MITASELKDWFFSGGMDKTPYNAAHRFNISIVKVYELLKDKE